MTAREGCRPRRDGNSLSHRKSTAPWRAVGAGSWSISPTGAASSFRRARCRFHRARPADGGVRDPRLDDVGAGPPRRPDDLQGQGRRRPRQRPQGRPSATGGLNRAHKRNKRTKRNDRKGNPSPPRQALAEEVKAPGSRVRKLLRRLDRSLAAARRSGETFSPPLDGFWRKEGLSATRLQRSGRDDGALACWPEIRRLPSPRPGRCGSGGRRPRGRPWRPRPWR